MSDRYLLRFELAADCEFSFNIIILAEMSRRMNGPAQRPSAPKVKIIGGYNCPPYNNEKKNIASGGIFSIFTIEYIEPFFAGIRDSSVRNFETSGNLIKLRVYHKIAFKCPEIKFFFEKNLVEKYVHFKFKFKSQSNMT